ncbi:MAG: molybdopterin-dependent oxidoreductase [Halarchaeum sp.]
MASEQPTSPDRDDAARRDAALALPARVATAVVGAVAALAGSYAAAGSTPDFVVAPVNAFVVNTSPASLVAFSIQTLGHLDDLLAFALSVALTLLLFALAVAVGLDAGRRTSVPLASAGVAALAVWALAAALTRRPAAALATALPAAVVVVLVTRLSTPAPDRSTVRRRVLLAAAGTVGFGALAALAGGLRTLPPGEEMAPPADAARLADQARAKELADVGDVPGLVSPIGEFYRVDIDSIDPMLDAGQWTLTVTGAVDDELALSYADLRAMDAATKFKTLRCVGEGLNDRLMGNAVWTGVPLADILARAVPGGDCGCVILRAADGYYEEFPLAALRTGFLAYGMNGASLPRAHGYPVRALVPGHWGEINVKWLTEIEILEREATGYWEERGWHGTGPVNTVAKLWGVERRDDGTVVLAGHAYAGTRGIERVDVSTDDGSTWTDAVLSDPLDPADVLGARDAWRQWRYAWTPDPGSHRVVVRATDGTGTVQSGEDAAAFPNGASGRVRRTIDV